MSDPGRQLPHHVFGATFEKSGFACEADLVLLLHSHHRPVLVIGEAKSYLDPLDEDDVMKLTTIRDAVRGRGLDCQLMFATLRDSLTGDEVRLLRSVAEKTPPALRTRGNVFASPLLPIVLTAKALSAETYSDAHPSRLANGSVETLATETAKRELGFSGFKFQTKGDPASALLPVWDDPSASPSGPVTQS
jgi:hypothetical protein